MKNYSVSYLRPDFFEVKMLIVLKIFLKLGGTLLNNASKSYILYFKPFFFVFLFLGWGGHLASNYAPYVCYPNI